MRNINKIKELKDDRYTFSLDNKQIASIIISTITLGAVLFAIGYFIGKGGANKKVVSNEIKTKNIAIINPVKTHEKTAVETQGIASLKEKKGLRSNATKVTDVAMQHRLKEKKEVNKPSDNNIVKTQDTASQTNGENKEKEEKIAINTPELPKKINNNKGTGNKPFKTLLKSNEAGKYILQVLATPKMKEAEELKNRLIESGYKAFIEKVDSNGVIYNRVRIGFFKSSEEAKIFKNNFEKESGIKKTFITIKK